MPSAARCIRALPRSSGTSSRRLLVCSSHHLEGIMSDVKETIRRFILTTYLPGESAANLHDDAPLRTTGVLDSLATIGLVNFLEREFAIELDPYETGTDTFDRIEALAALVARKISTTRPL